MVSAISELLLTFLGLRLARAYRPEIHYMRGPGPKCRAKPGSFGTFGG